MLILNDDEIEQLLEMSSCIEAVEAAFRARGSGSIAKSAVAGVPLPGGKLHAKLASLNLGHAYAVAKINANLPGNPSLRGLPSIQGVVVLFDAVAGTPLAALESGTITSIRTAAASAVAAKWLALPNASSLALIGCGVQARAHVAAMLCVRPIKTIHAYDINAASAERFCMEMSTRHEVDCCITHDPRGAALAAQIVVTTTTSHHAILDAGDVAPGAFIAAVGADNEDKQEIGVDLLRNAVVVVDDLEQCTRMGDLHHALVANALKSGDVRASLDQVVAGQVHGRLSDQEVIVFDSTGVAIEDAAAAALVYEKVLATKTGVPANQRGLPYQSVTSDRSSS